MILRNKVQIQQHIKSLQELKEEYARKGDSLNVRIITRMIAEQENALLSYQESGD